MQLHGMQLWKDIFASLVSSYLPIYSKGKMLPCAKQILQMLNFA